MKIIQKLLLILTFQAFSCFSMQKSTQNAITSDRCELMVPEIDLFTLPEEILAEIFIHSMIDKSSVSSINQGLIILAQTCKKIKKLIYNSSSFAQKKFFNLVWQTLSKKFNVTYSQIEFYLPQLKTNEINSYLSSNLFDCLKKAQKTFINSQLNDGSTVLMNAALKNNTIAIREILAEQYVDINKANNLGYTALSLAAFMRNYEAVKLLLEKNTIDLSIKNLNGSHALDLARQRNAQNIVKLLEQHVKNSKKKKICLVM